MRSTTLAFSIIILVLAFCFCSACLSLPSQKATVQETVQAPSPAPASPLVTPGMAQITQDSGMGPMSLDRAIVILEGHNPEAEKDTNLEKIVYRLQGKDLDESGNAGSWIFTTSLNDSVQMIMIDGGGQNSVPTGSIGETGPIAFDTIMQPSALFSKNKQVVSPADLPVSGIRRDLELSGDVYSVIITSGSTIKVYRFDAKTGDLII
jgi:hypothetical protein